MVGLGDTTKKLQKVAGMAEDVYQRMTELRDQMVELRETVEATHETVRSVERRVTEQEALVRELAEREGIDVEAVLAEANIEEAEPDGETGAADDDPEESDANGDVTGERNETGSGPSETPATAGDDEPGSRSRE